MAKDKTTTEPLTPISRTAARLSFTAAATFLVLLAALHVIKPEFDPSWHFISGPSQSLRVRPGIASATEDTVSNRQLSQCLKGRFMIQVYEEGGIADNTITTKPHQLESGPRQTSLVLGTAIAFIDGLSNPD